MDYCEKHHQKHINLYSFPTDPTKDTTVIEKTFGCCACRTEELREHFG